MLKNNLQIRTRGDAELISSAETMNPLIFSYLKTNVNY